MGLINGFLSGAAFTSLTLYLTLSLHRQARCEQSLRLNQSLTSIRWTTRTLVDDPAVSGDPSPEEPASHSKPTSPSPDTYHPTVQNGVIDRLKANWNAELVSGVRYVQSINWSDLVARAEDGVATGLGRVLEDSRSGVEASVDTVSKAAGEAREVVRSTGLRDLDAGAGSLGRELGGVGRSIRDAAVTGRREGY